MFIVPAYRDGGLVAVSDRMFHVVIAPWVNVVTEVHTPDQRLSKDQRTAAGVSSSAGMRRSAVFWSSTDTPSRDVRECLHGAL